MPNDWAFALGQLAFEFGLRMMNEDSSGKDILTYIALRF